MTFNTAIEGAVHPFTYVVATVFIVKALVLAIGEFFIDRMRQRLIVKLATGIPQQDKDDYNDLQEAKKEAKKNGE